MDSHQALESMLNERLEVTQAERLAVKESLDTVETKIKFLLARIGQKPKESESNIIEQTKQIEYDHSTKPQNNADERKFMRDLEKLKQKKKMILEYNSVQEELDDFKNKKSALMRELKEKERVLDDLFQGARKLKAAVKFGCSPSEIVEKKIAIPDDKISRVIGKGGANVKQIEIDCNVVIESDRGSFLRINGKEDSILAAEEKLNVLINTVSEEFPILEEAIVCLTLGKASLMQQIQSLYAVRMDLSKPKRLCCITGLPENVSAARAEVAAIRCSRVEIMLEDSVLPFIIGKGGVTIRALQTEHSVQLDVSRESHRIVVLGFEDDVSAAGTIISAIIDENREVEELIEVDRNVVMGAIIGAKGAVVRMLQKDLNVYIHSKKAGGGNEQDNTTTSSNGSTELLSIRGTASNVIPAKAKIMEMIHDYQEHTDVIPFADEVMPQLVGRKGARISQLRLEHPEVQIDVDAGQYCVRLNCFDDEARNAAKSAVVDIIMANQRATVFMDLDTTVALKGARGAAVRATIQNELALSMDILSLEEMVKVRGEHSAVQRAVALLEEFRDNNFTVEVPCFDEDSTALFGGGENSPGKQIETKCHVEISHDRKKGILRIRGSKAAVDEAEAAIAIALEGGEDGGTRLVEADASSMSALIGRGGANIKKLETQHNVHLDILRSRGFVRIRGDPADVEGAKRAVIAFIQSLRVMMVVLRPAGVSTAEAMKVVMRASVLFFGVDMETNEYEILLRGPQRVVLEAKKFVVEQLNDSATVSVPLSEGQFAVLEVNVELNFKQIRDTHRVTVQMDGESQSVVVTGPAEGVLKAQEQLYRMLDYLFPFEFASLPMDLVCVAEAGSYAFVQKVQEETGAMLEANIPLQCVRLRGTMEAVAAASNLVRDAQPEWRSRATIVPLQDHMIPLILGKKGSNITALENETSTSISVDRMGKRLIIVGATEEAVSKASAEMNCRIEKLQQEHWEIVLDDRLFGPMIGKQGAHVNKLRLETGANIDMDAKTLTVKVSGPADKVTVAKERILTFLAEQRKEKEKESSFSVKVRVPAAALPVIIGTKGATVQRIQNNYGVRLDLDRVELLASIRGSPEGCAQAVVAIRELVDQEGLDPAAVIVLTSGSVSTGPGGLPAAVAGESVIGLTNDLGASKGMAVGVTVDSAEMANLQAIADRVKAVELSKPATLSKSALKRLRKKNKAEDDDADVDVDDGSGDYASESAAAAAVVSNEEVDLVIARRPLHAPDVSATAAAMRYAPPAAPHEVSVECAVTKQSSIGSRPTQRSSSPVVVTGVEPPSSSPLSPPPGLSLSTPPNKTSELLAMLLGSAPSVPAPARSTSLPDAVVPPPMILPSTSTLTAQALLPPAAAAAAASTASNVSQLTALLGISSPPISRAGKSNGTTDHPSNGQYFKSKSGFTVRL